MLFGTQYKTNQIQNDFKLALNNTDIAHVKVLKFLGVTVDENFT